MRIVYGFFVVLLLFLATFLVSGARVSDNTNVAVPTDNGTSSNTSATGLMEQYVGFYGNLTMQVRNNTAAGNVLHQKGVTSGVMYFLKTGQVIPAAIVNATANTTADGILGLTGWYISSNHFDTRTDTCGVTNVSRLTTTDSRITGLLSNTTNNQYFFCTNVSSFTSTNGFGTINYEIVVPKTGLFTAYDIWYDLA